MSAVNKKAVDEKPTPASAAESKRITEEKDYVDKQVRLQCKRLSRKPRRGLRVRLLRIVRLRKKQMSRTSQTTNNQILAQYKKVLVCVYTNSIQMTVTHVFTPLSIDTD